MVCIYVVRQRVVLLKVFRNIIILKCLENVWKYGNILRFLSASGLSFANKQMMDGIFQCVLYPGIP